jgi:inner membrane protein
MVNHLAGGTVLTGFFASVLFGINILASPFTLAATAIASLLPDIDHTRSLIGKACLPLSRWLNRRFGHRTITHGLPCLFALTLLSATVEEAFFHQSRFTAILLLGYFFHLLLDMCTLQGVPLLYPFSRSPFVLIGNPQARLRTGDHRREAVVLCIFVVAGFSLQGLFAKGFWTTFNQQFATLPHLNSEFLRSRDLLRVEYEVLDGSQTRKGYGFCIESRETEAWLLDSLGNWVHLQHPACRRSMPIHTGRSFSVRTAVQVNVTADSLNAALCGLSVLALEVQASQPFQYTEPGTYPKSANSLKTSHLAGAPFFAELPTSPDKDTFIPDHSYLAEVRFLETEIRHIQRDAAAARLAAQRHQSYTAQLYAQYAATQDVTERQRLHDQIAEALAYQNKLPKVDESRTEQLYDRISKIREEARLKESARRTSVLAHNQAALSQLQPLRFTAVVSYVEGVVGG